MQKVKLKKTGFTLLELLVVIAIIGILSSAVLVSLSSSRAKGRDGKRIAEIGQMRSALDIYFNTYDRYPKYAEVYPTDGVCASGDICLSPAIISSIPTDPITGAPYYYAGLKSAGQSAGDTRCMNYHLGADLEDVTVDSTITKSDFDSPVGTVCAGGGTDFDASVPLKLGQLCSGIAGKFTDPPIEYCYDISAVPAPSGGTSQQSQQSGGGGGSFGGNSQLNTVGNPGGGVLGGGNVQSGGGGGIPSDGGSGGMGGLPGGGEGLPAGGGGGGFVCGGSSGTPCPQ